MASGLGKVRTPVEVGVIQYYTEEPPLTPQSLSRCQQFHVFLCEELLSGTFCILVAEILARTWSSVCSKLSAVLLMEFLRPALDGAVQGPAAHLALLAGSVPKQLHRCSRLHAGSSTPLGRVALDIPLHGHQSGCLIISPVNLE